MLPRAQGMNIAVFRLGVNWVVRTKTQELTFTELGDAMNAAARYRQRQKIMRTLIEEAGLTSWLMFNALFCSCSAPEK